jgi:hypothetical protein
MNDRGPLRWGIEACAAHRRNHALDRRQIDAAELGVNGTNSTVAPDAQRKVNGTVRIGVMVLQEIEIAGPESVTHAGHHSRGPSDLRPTI